MLAQKYKPLQLYYLFYSITYFVGRHQMKNVMSNTYVIKAIEPKDVLCLQNISNPSIRQKHWHHCHASRSRSWSRHQRLQSDYGKILETDIYNFGSQIWISGIRSPIVVCHIICTKNAKSYEVFLKIYNMCREEDGIPTQMDKYFQKKKSYQKRWTCNSLTMERTFWETVPWHKPQIIDVGLRIQGYRYKS